MGRKQDRKAAKRETNAVVELCRVQRKYVPERIYVDKRYGKFAILCDVYAWYGRK